MNAPRMDRRALLASAGAAVALGTARAAPDDGKALVAITLDLEMSRNFPTWETTHWDYEKGNLDDEITHDIRNDEGGMMK